MEGNQRKKEWSRDPIVLINGLVFLASSAFVLFVLALNWLGDQSKLTGDPFRFVSGLMVLSILIHIISVYSLKLADAVTKRWKEKVETEREYP